MTNAVRGLVTHELDGKTYQLEFTIDALIQLEDALDCHSVEILQKLAAGAPRLVFVRAMIWGALRAHHPEITLLQAGELLRADGGGGLGDKVTTAFVESWPKAEAGDAGDPPKRQAPAAAGTGASSSSPGSSATAGRRTRTGAKPREASS